MKIVFENQHFVAVDKESGWLSVPARDASDPRPILGRQLELIKGKAIFPVHRLDAEVSGLVLYALTANAHRQASMCFENRQVQKTYQAFTKGGGFERGDQGQWKAQILRGKKRAYESPVGKQTITDFEVVASSSGIHEWRLRPRTGRSHQLRWELYRHDSAILGDTLYGSLEVWHAGGVALRSLSLQFETEFCKTFELPEILQVLAWPAR